MAKKLYVGNLSYHCSDADLFDTFVQFGDVTSARVVLDRETNRSKGFGFVEMNNDNEADQAIDQMNGKPFMGRPMTVNEARPRAEGPGGAQGGGHSRRPSNSSRPPRNIFR